jgi:tetratricopeptide (TPR) repeat protein
MLALAEKLRIRYWLTSALWRNENLSRLAGDWRVARDCSDRGLAVSPTDSRLLHTRALLEYEVGDFRLGEVYLERLLEGMRLVAPGPNVPYVCGAITIPMVARITGVVDRRFDVAAAAAETILSSPSATPAVTMFARVGLALLAVQRGNVGAIGEQYAALESRQGTMVDGGIAAADRLLGLMAQTMRNLDQAVAHFEGALVFCRKAGYRPELAWTCCDYGDALLQRNRPGDREQANALLTEALSLSRELGMRPLMERVLSRREILKA